MDNIKISKNLVKDEYGIYKAKNSAVISYPADGNRKCFSLEDKSFWFKFRNRCITAVIKKHPPVSSLIDLGGGNGYVTSAILEAGIDAILLEPGYEGAYNGKNKRNIPVVICSTLEGAGFEKSSIDAIGCFDVIEHIENDQLFIETIYNLVNVGGYIYVTVPAHNWLWSESDVEAKHFRRYSKKSIEKLLNEKFEVQYSSYFFSYLLFPIFIFRRIPFLIKTNKSKKILSDTMEHGAGNELLEKIMNWLFSFEVKNISAGKKMIFGASCIVVAKKIK